jgi:hypothetical protein
MRALSTGDTHGLVVVAGPVADVDPTAARRRRADGPDATQPNLAFIGGIQGQCRSGVVGRRPHPPLLKGQAQEAAVVGPDSQTVVLLQASAAMIADGAQARNGGMVGEIAFGGVVNNQGQGLVGQGGACLLPVRSLDGLEGGLVLLTHAIKSSQRVPVEDLGKGPTGVVGNSCGRGDQALGAPSVTELDAAKGGFGPGIRVCQSFATKYLNKAK